MLCSFPSKNNIATFCNTKVHNITFYVSQVASLGKYCYILLCRGKKKINISVTGSYWMLLK